jgi:hypothetical protein
MQQPDAAEAVPQNIPSQSLDLSRSHSEVEASRREPFEVQRELEGQAFSQLSAQQLRA